MYFLSSCDNPRRCSSTEVSYGAQAFLLLIQQEYKSLRDRDVFIEIFQPLAKYVTQHEPETLAYEISISDKDPHKLLVFERWGSSLLPETAQQI